MRRIMLTVAYDGTAYSGWQIQPNAPTIEGVLNEELSRLLGENITVIGASRTDAGVHAEGAIAVFDTNSKIPGEKFSYALNRSLPGDIVIRKSQEVPCDFHPRKTSTRKTYRYSVWNDDFELPTTRLYTYNIYNEIDVEAMDRAARYFLGEHDFAGFCSVGNQTETTVRTIYNITVSRREDERQIDIMVTGNGFLYNMVRIIAGTLIEVGRHRMNAEDMETIIASCDRNQAGPTAPAKGLTLMGYEFLEYPDIIA